MTALFHRLAGTAAALSLLAGCAVGPDYRHPDTGGLPARFAEAGDDAGQPDPATLMRYWQAFNDPELDRLEQRALAAGLDMRAAAARIREARIAARTARARFLPEINATGNVSRIDFSKNAGLASIAQLFGGGAGGGSTGGIAAPGNGITTFAAGFDASWELDLFGGGRRAAEAATDRLAAAQWTARDAAVTLSGEVARHYLQLRSLQEQEAALNDELARDRAALKLRADTARVGLAPQTDPTRDRASVAQTEAAIVPLQVDERIEMHALALLLDQAPGSLIAELTPPPALPPPPPVPVGLPSALLLRRPDVRAAEQNLAAATADIGVATADLYPKITLSGVAELLSTTLRNLISGDSLQGQGSAAAMFPLLDFGRRRAAVAAKREEAELAYISYQRTVLGALRDVEDALVREHGERQRNRLLRQSMTDSMRGLQATQERYRVGLVDLSAVLQAQQGVIQLRQTIATSDGALRQDIAALYKALGGGWQGVDVDQLEKASPLYRPTHAARGR